MAKEILCPICGATYNLADDQIGKKVRCRKCEHPFVAGGRSKERSRDDDDDDAIQDRPRGRLARRPVEDDDRPAKKTPKLEAQAKPRSDEPQFPVKTFVIAGGILIGFVLLCGGGGVGLYLLWPQGDSRPNAPVVGGPNPPNRGFNPPGFNPPPPPIRNAPPAPQIANVDKALEVLRSNEASHRQEAARWLAQAPLDAGKQAEVAKALNAVLAPTEPDDVRNAAATACRVWAMAENIPAMTEYLQKNHGNIFAKEGRVAVMQALARLKSERAAEALVKELSDFHVTREARDALREFGPKAEKAVVAALFKPDPHTNSHEAARELLRGYGTKDEVILDAALAEMKAADDPRKVQVLQWLAKARPVEAKKPEVGRLLGECLQSANDEVAKEAAAASPGWATAETVPGLVAYLGRFHGNIFVKEQRAAAMRALAILKDERGAEPIAKDLQDHFLRGEAQSALRELGPKAEKAVARLVFANDQGAADAARDLLRGYGTKEDALAPMAAEALVSTDRWRRERAVTWLEKTPPGMARRDEVAQAVNVLLEDSDGNVRSWGARVALKWGTKDNVPGLVRQLEDKNLGAGGLRKQAMAALAEIKHEDGVWPIALWVGDFFTGKDAEAALAAYGPVAEKGLVKHLGDPDPKDRERAWRLLSALGTQATANDAKAALAKEMNPAIRTLGNAALKLMQGRPAPKTS